MQKRLKVKFTSVLCSAFIGLAAVFFSKTARANLNEGHSFRPIGWERDFVSSSSLSFTVMKLLPGAQIISTPERAVASAYGLQLGQNLRDNWAGRISMFCGRTGPGAGEYVWSYLASDLLHPLMTEEMNSTGPFRYARPFGFFGVGMTTRWQNMSLNLNLIPTLRYEATEPTAFAGVLLQIPVANELMLAVEYRFMQSARNSQTRGNVLGGSLVWGQMVN
jgi:hypothetical protein